MIVTKGATDITTYVMMVDSAAGTPETGLTISNIDLQYTRNQSAPAAKVDAVALAATNTAHTDNRGIEIDATSSPGLYRIDWPDAAFATGADKVVLCVTCSGCAPAVLLVELVNYNTQDGVRLGLTALPNAAADAAGGLIISDAGGLDADAQRADVAAILVDTGTTLDARIPAALVGGRMDASVGAMAANVITAAATAADFLAEINAEADTAIADAALATAAALATVDTVVDAILVDTNELQTDWADGGRLDLILDARASQTSVNTIDDFLDTEVAAIKTETDKIASIKTKTDSLTFTVASVLDANVQRINDVTITGNGQVGTEFGV